MATKAAKKTVVRKAPAKTGIRRVALVGVNPARASMKKISFTRFVVAMLDNDDGWMEYAAFKNKSHAEVFAKHLFNEKQGSMSVKVIDSES